MDNIKATPLKNVSSTIGEVFYDPEKKILQVNFKSGGKYSYEPVDYFTFTALVTAPSPGSYLNKEIIKNPEITTKKL